MVHTYRNRERKGSHLIGDAVFALTWSFGGLAALGVAESFLGDSLLMLVVSAPVLVLWMAPLYSHVFRRFYEIRLSDEGSCEFRGALRTRQRRAQQIVSIDRDARRTWRSEGDETEHTLLRFQGGGSLVIVQPIEGFDDFLTRLQALNPFIELNSGASPSRPEP
jgi:hypothetical protein